MTSCHLWLRWISLKVLWTNSLTFINYHCHAWLTILHSMDKSSLIELSLSFTYWVSMSMLFIQRESKLWNKIQKDTKLIHQVTEIIKKKTRKSTRFWMIQENNQWHLIRNWDKERTPNAWSILQKASKKLKRKGSYCSSMDRKNSKKMKTKLRVNRKC